MIGQKRPWLNKGAGLLLVSIAFPVQAVGVVISSVAAGDYHACALLGNGTMKCWGWNRYGALGQGDNSDRGDDASEMGNNLSGIDIGTGRTVTAIAAGSYYGHTCALLDNGAVKCWGNNGSGQLGQGDTFSRGDETSEMGDNLSVVSLGTGRTATAIATGNEYTCALLDYGAVKCWGDNGSGQLGQGDISDRGDGANEMGDNLSSISLGTGRTAVAVAAGYAHTCALLDNGTVKCWGYNSYGQLGRGDTYNRGGNANQMGDNLSSISLGTGRTATAIATGNQHTCALLDNGTVKCWGRNDYGQLGQGDTSDRGDDANEMGDNLSSISLGTGRTAVAVAAAQFHTCALLDNGTVKCWGRNSSGQLGQGDTSTRGDGANEMGDNLSAISLGTGRMATSVAANGYYTCALLDNGTLKCWGENSYGQLGQGDTANRGNGASQMGDNLPAISLTPPGTPGSFVFNVLGTSSISWTWGNVSYEDGFRVVSSSGGNMSGNLAADTTFFTETGLSANTFYHRRVVSYNAESISTSTALAVYTLAAPPTGFVFSGVETTSISVQWGANGNSSTTTYQAKMWQPSGSTTTLTVTVTSATFTGLSGQTTYYFTVRAINGDSIATEYDAIITTITHIAPTTLSPSIGSVYITSVTVSWTSVLGAEAVAVLASNSGYSSVVASATLTANTTTFLGLSGNTTYYFQVKIASETDGAYSLNRISTTTQPLGVTLAVSVISLDFGVLKAGESGIKVFSLSNSGAGTLSGTVSSDSGWLSVDPVSFSGNTTITAVASASGLSDGQFGGNITIASNGGNVAVSVSVTATCVLTKPNPYSLSTGRPLVFFGSGVVPYDTEINIYTLSRDWVATLHETSGSNEISWDGRNNWGNKIVPGIYLYTTKSPTEKNAGKFTVVR